MAFKKAGSAEEMSSSDARRVNWRSETMLFIDLVSSVSRALPRLADAAARRTFDEGIFEPNIGYGFFRPDKSDTIEPFGFEPSYEGPDLQSTRLGILGTGPIIQVVASVARQRLGADVVAHPSAPAAEHGGDLDVCGQSLGDVLAAPAICIAFPWSERLLEQVQRNKFAPTDPRTVLVVWRRSPTIERALIYLGQHYIEPVQLCTLAKVACISKFHLVRLFTSTLGISPHRYQLLLRLAQAKAMLRDGSCIARIAQTVGFGDHSHLDRSFRILVGMTPTQYQQALQR
jgi:AraC-like DNA-binding protein